ncbi:hypothetical protein GH714_023075 [Hevea brasiliensis]|uniref:DYW domain-containing protein n=1 Tax=Hevea brasiliensis TaxID=3981 RepID=A0A6A6N1V0_HEVBR|nr:hypothetical protein GH714_023075 [Hevea brasiliensis]
MYGTVGRWDDAAQVRILQRDQGFKKSPGCSWIEIGGVVHAFIGGDRSHPQYPQINNKIDELLVEMKRLGYHGESSYVLQDVEDEEKEQILLYHSEKLAIAFGILNLNPNKPILVTKNLRVCGDCHTAIKLISLITKRNITERDYEGGTAGCRNHIAFAGWPEPVHLGFQNEFHSLFQEWVRIITITTLMTDEEILQGL